MIKPCLCPVCRLLLVEVLPGRRTPSYGGTPLQRGQGYALFVQRPWAPTGPRYLTRPGERSLHVGGDGEDHSVR